MPKPFQTSFFAVQFKSNVFQRHRCGQCLPLAVARGTAGRSSGGASGTILDSPVGAKNKQKTPPKLPLIAAAYNNLFMEISFSCKIVSGHFY